MFYIGYLPNFLGSYDDDDGDDDDPSSSRADPRCEHGITADEEAEDNRDAQEGIVVVDDGSFRQWCNRHHGRIHRCGGCFFFFSSCGLMTVCAVTLAWWSRTKAGEDKCRVFYIRSSTQCHDVLTSPQCHDGANCEFTCTFSNITSGMGSQLMGLFCA